MLDYSCAGLRLLFAIICGACRFPKLVILYASLLAFGLFYPTRSESCALVCLLNAT